MWLLDDFEMVGDVAIPPSYAPISPGDLSDA